MTEVRYVIAAPVAAAAIVMFAAPAVASPPQVRFELPRTSRITDFGPTDLRQLFATSSTLPASKTYEPVEGVDFGELTDADVAMMAHALNAGAQAVDFSEFYLDDED